MIRGGWRYRLGSVFGVIALATVAFSIANSSTIQNGMSVFPVVGKLAVDPPSGAEGVAEVVTAIVVVTAVLVPMYKPRPRRILDTVIRTQKRVVVAILVLATIGYFDYTYRLPRITLLIATPILLIVLPAWFLWIRRRPSVGPERTIIVGDSPEMVQQLAGEVDSPLLGYLCPTIAFDRNERSTSAAVADGGVEGLERLGGLSRIEDILVEYNVKMLVLAFKHTDRSEFFGALDACYEHGVDAKVHRDHADQVLTSEGDVGTLIEVDIEPWDVQDYVLKRMFDVAFSWIGLLVLSPVILGIAIAIKLDDGGSVLYKQERTAIFGETFDVYKFRSMSPGDESEAPVDDEENDRITRVGRLIRQTHLDEIPQLWSVLVGDMSVVGPRAVWTEEESLLEAQTQSWRRRWFVKPGLTGLAQVNDIKSIDPEEKLRYDLEYVKQQSVWLDMKLVIRQIWKICSDVIDTVP